jgi:DNA-binding MarR family transcriptional regulator
MHITKLPCYCATLRQAARALTSLYDEHLRDTGLRITQFTLLQALSLTPGVRITDLVNVLAMDQTTLTRTLAALQANGWVQVADRPSGREKCWELTREGTALFSRAQPVWEQAQKQVQKQFGKNRAASMHTEVFELAEAVTE